MEVEKFESKRLRFLTKRLTTPKPTEATTPTTTTTTEETVEEVVSEEAATVSAEPSEKIPRRKLIYNRILRKKN